MPATKAPRRADGSTQHLTREEELELAKLVERGDKAAREALILANQGLVWHVLRSEFRTFYHVWDDLFQEGQVGLIKAVDRFDWRKGCRFSSYAVWWIRRGVQLALGRWLAGAARVPESRMKELRELNLVIGKLEDRLGRYPTPEEIASEMHASPEKVCDLLHMMSATRGVVSLDAMAEGGRCPLDLIADAGTPSPEEERFAWRLRDILWRVIKLSLTTKQKEVICLRYGLDVEGRYQRPLSQRAIAQRMNISPQAVSQLEERALAKMKAEMDLITSHLGRVG